MTFMQLKIFVTIAELGNVTRAAELLCITQSAASAAMAALENSYEVKLFNRIGRAIELSEVGRRFLTEAQAALTSSQNAQRYLRELGGKTVGKLDIAASQTIANYWLPRRLALFHARYPDVSLNVTMSNTQQVESAVMKSSADIGFVEGPVSSQHLKLQKVDHDQPALIVSTRRWLSLGMTGNPIDLGKLPWITRESGSGTRRVLEDLAKKKGLKWGDLNIVLELPSNESVKEAVEAGVGVTLISRHVVASSLKSGTLRAVPLDIPPRSFHMVLYKDRDVSDAARALIDMIGVDVRDPH